MVADISEDLLSSYSLGARNNSALSVWEKVSQDTRKLVEGEHEFAKFFTLFSGVASEFHEAMKPSAKHNENQLAQLDYDVGHLRRFIHNLRKEEVNIEKLLDVLELHLGVQKKTLEVLMNKGDFVQSPYGYKPKFPM